MIVQPAITPSVFSLLVFVSNVLGYGAGPAKEVSMNQESPVAVQLYVFGEAARAPGAKFEGVLETVKRAGFSNVQGWLDLFDSEEDANQLVATLSKFGLRMPAAYHGGAMHTQEGADETLTLVLRRAAIAKDHGLEIVVMNPDPIGREKTDEELALQSRNLNQLGARLRELGLRLAVHQHDPEMKSEAREWYHILHHTDDDKVFFCLDLHWVYRGGQDPYRLLRDAGKRTIDLHLRNSVDGVWAQDLGEGDIDYGRVEKILDEIGYEGSLTVELAYEKGTKTTRALGANLGRSREFVRRTFGV
jgi:inosose dehydratase